MDSKIKVAPERRLGNSVVADALDSLVAGSAGPASNDQLAT